MSAAAADDQLAAFIERYQPELQTLAVALLARMRQLVPGATRLVYDNYNAP